MAEFPLCNQLVASSLAIRDKKEGSVYLLCWSTCLELVVLSSLIHFGSNVAQLSEHYKIQGFGSIV